MRIGIITFYHNSINYGGNLQAYALCEAISKHTECKVEQISYDSSYQIKKSKRITVKSLLRPLVKLARKARQGLKDFGIHKKLKIRKKAFQRFNKDVIRHSARAYTKKDISACLDNYDAFVAGSDQIWNPMWWDSVYRLEFVPSNKTKIAYAVSLGQKFLSYGQEDMLEACMKDFKAISVREEGSIELLSDLAPTAVEWTLDPTLLLDSGDWDLVVSERRVKEKYLFCYFLGDDIEQRKLAVALAEKYGLRLVTIPNIMGHKRKCDKGFGDIGLYDVSPADFVSLIKHASLVITDSFHATVFSYIYKKEFVVLERTEHKAMSTRISSLMSLIKLNDRFLSTREMASIPYIEKLTPIDYGRDSEEFLYMKDKSIDFLRRNIK